MLLKSGMQERSDTKLHDDLVFAIQRAANAYQSEVSRLAKQAGLSFPQYSVLRILGAREGSLSCSEISEQMATRDPDITRLIDRLVKAGYVSRERCSEDRRVVRSCITDEGRALIQRVETDVERLHSRLFGPLQEPDLRRLEGALRSLNTGSR